MKKPIKIGEIKIKINEQIITFKIWNLNSEYWANYDKSKLPMGLDFNLGSVNLANLISIIRFLEEKNGKIISFPKKIRNLVNKEAILIRLEED